MILNDAVTALPVADSTKYPINTAVKSLADSTHSDLQEKVYRTASSMILSVSGWRKVFADHEESASSEISSIDTLLVGAIALAYANHVIRNKPGKKQEILLGMDTRPTGPTIADIVCRILLAKGLDVQHIFISSAPELMAYSATNGTTDGFFYISASHNPIGHNGIKFGRAGGVIDREEAAVLIDSFLELCRDHKTIQQLIDLEKSVPEATYSALLQKIEASKLKAVYNYRGFVVATASSTNGVCGQDQILSRIRQYAETFGLGIVIDFNGSARTLSIDTALYDELGISVKTLNDKPRQIVHGIIPEGENLGICKQALETAHAENPSFLLGYMPDNDGDRGNIVYIDEASGAAHILKAQEVFALAVLSELAFIEYTRIRSKSDEPIQKTAVVVNGPTSLRINAIAAAFGAEVHRSEVGEANTVNLAAKLRNDGYIVRILGEGSNGGNITYPAAVRDPLNTIFSFLKLIALQDDKDSPGLFSIWCERTNHTQFRNQHVSFADIINTLPAYTTTGTSEPDAILNIRSTSQAAIKAAYEELFIRQWEMDRGSMFREMGIISWKMFNTEGLENREGMGSEFRSGRESGGLKVLFYNAEQEATDFIWMRGSGTEPVFRVLADSQGTDVSREKRLLQWHTALVEAADQAVTQTVS